MIFIDNKYTKWYNNIISNAKSRILTEFSYYEIHHIIPKSLGGNNSNENLVKLSAREHFICHLLLTKITIGVDKRNMNFAFWSLSNKRKNSSNIEAYDYYINSRFYQRAKENFSFENSKTHKGKILSQETKNKISKAHKGKKLSEDHKKKINPKGRILSDDTKDKISKGQIGRIGGMQNKHHSEETKLKISIGNKGKIMPKLSDERKQQISKQFTGTIQNTEHISKRVSSRQANGYYKNKTETKRKMSESAKNRSKYTCHCGKECSLQNFKRWHGENCKLSS